MNRCLFVLIILPLMGDVSFAVTKSSSKELLAQSMVHFDKGEYRQALDLLKNIEIRADFDSSGDMLIAFKIKAISYSELNEKDQAVETIRELFFLDPEYKFDLFDTPASTVELVERERKSIEEKNALLAQAKHELQPSIAPDSPKPSPENILIEKKIPLEKPPHILSSLVPFGINHFILDSPIKGTIYAAIQTISLSANIGSFWLKQSYLTDWGSNHLKNLEDKKKFASAQTAQYISLGGLVLSYALSVIDAMIKLSQTNTQN